jgi:hypothetical protein
MDLKDECSSKYYNIQQTVIEEPTGNVWSDNNYG